MPSTFDSLPRSRASTWSAPRPCAAGRGLSVMKAVPVLLVPMPPEPMNET